MFCCSFDITLKTAYNRHKFSVDFQKSHSTLSDISFDMLYVLYCSVFFTYDVVVSTATLLQLYCNSTATLLQLYTKNTHTPLKKFKKLKNLQRHLVRPQNPKFRFQFFQFSIFTVFRFHIPRIYSSYSDIDTNMNLLRCSITQYSFIYKITFVGKRVVL